MSVNLITRVCCLWLVLGLSACDWPGNHSVQGYVESENLYVTSSLSGTLRSLPVSRGDLIKKGDLIFQLDSNPEELKLREVEQVLIQEEALLEDLKRPKRKPEVGMVIEQIQQVQARLLLAKLRMKRFQMLYQKKAGTLDEADAAVQRFRELQALKRQREYELAFVKMGARQNKILAQASKVHSVMARKELFTWQLAQKTRYAPDRGLVLDTFFLEGEWVPAGKPIAVLLIPTYIWIEFFLPAKYLPKLNAGQEVEVKCDGCASNLKAIIEYISPEAEYVPPLVYSRENYDKLVFRVKARPEHPELFKPGQPVTVTGF
ncbi:MAG: HlyD family efflux transporter periplasmic adaptor subunit [Legionellaceae bacterium]|nr:HlyD family efflux transporter periplasmic adaptor subunit [Legionellaceae bacterium]